jgi:hypothetical protein
MLNAPDVRPPGCLRKSLAHLVMRIDSPSSAFLYVSSLGPVSVSVSDLDDSLYFALGFSRVDGGGGIRRIGWFKSGKRRRSYVFWVGC